MNSIKTIIRSLLIIALSLSSFLGQAQAFQFSNLYFVGDSLTDLGNNTNSALCNFGVCTNSPGFTWAHFLGAKFGKHITTSNSGGTDYAYSGASTNFDPLFPTIISVNQQVNAMIQAQHGHLDKNALYSIWAGGDNLLDEILGAQNYSMASTQASSDIRNDVIKMHNAGAKFIVVGNLPDLTQTPGAQAFLTPQERQQLKQQGVDNMNNQIRNKINSLGFDVIQVDFFNLFEDILANPAAYGFNPNTINQACPDPNGACTGYLFVYFIHPTVAGHKIIADYVYSVLTAPSFYANLASIPVNTLQSTNSAIEQQLMPFIPSKRQHHFHVFVTGNFSPNQKIDNSYNIPQINTDYNSGTIGFTNFLNDAFEFGGSFSHGGNNSTLTQNMGYIDSTANIFSLFASYYSKHNIYVNAMINGGALDFNHIDRRFYLGPKRVDALGTTNGSVYGAAIHSGWFIWHHQQVYSGPYATLDYAHVNVDGYTEYNAPRGVNISYNNQHNDNLATGLGWHVRWTNDIAKEHLVTNIYASVNHQWIGGNRNIYFHVASIVGSHAYLPVTNATLTYFNGGINFATIFPNDMVFSLGYNAYAGENHFFSQNINVALSVPLY